MGRMFRPFVFPYVFRLCRPSFWHHCGFDRYIFAKPSALHHAFVHAFILKCFSRFFFVFFAYFMPFSTRMYGFSVSTSPVCAYPLIFALIWPLVAHIPPIPVLSGVSWIFIYYLASFFVIQWLKVILTNSLLRIRPYLPILDPGTSSTSIFLSMVTYLCSPMVEHWHISISNLCSIPFSFFLYVVRR